MKRQETITEVITKNINYALGAIPRAFGTEKRKLLRKAKGNRAVKKAAKKVKSAVRKIAKKKPGMKTKAKNKSKHHVTVSAHAA